MSKSLSLSVHDLVDFLLRKGDINSFIYSNETMQEGTRLHSSYQKNQDTNYVSEYFLKETFYVEDYEVTLEGRADGVIFGDVATIEEIKSTVIDLDQFKEEQEEWHLGQAKCYALMLAHSLNAERVNVNLIYISQISNSHMKKFTYSFNVHELEFFVTSLIEEYLSFQSIMTRHVFKRDESINKLEFPFYELRDGQEEMMLAVDKTIKNKKRLFIEAPTGIGKTMASIFPSLKSLYQGEIDRIFYLTAKGSGKASAMNALNVLRNEGLHITSVTLTAKEKICPNDIKTCVPSKCPFARGYYSKIFNVLKESFSTYSNFDLETILKIAHTHEVCPFELQLDISTFVSFIIGDYNYFFDPGAYLRRHFDEDSAYHLVLVDEAHNLIDRSKEMYSASFDLKDFLDAKDDMKKWGRKKLNSAYLSLVKYLKTLKEQIGELNELKVDFLPSELYVHINAFKEAMVYFLTKYEEDATEKMLDIYHNLLTFSSVDDAKDDTYITYYENYGKDHFIVHLYTIDAHAYLVNMLSRVNTTIFYSGTLTPMDYYVRSLGDDDDNMTIASPFPQNNFLFIAYPSLSLRYQDRSNTILEVKNIIIEACSHKIANYLVFAPSYEYLNQLKEVFNHVDNLNILFQKKDMGVDEVDDFLSNFEKNPQVTTIGFAVLGGVFAEGVDLAEDRLSGVICVTVGLPKPSLPREEMKKYHDENEENGFAFAYFNPGIMRLLQAFGRVIRSPYDRGFALLIDHRAVWKSYYDVFKNKYQNVRRVDNVRQLNYVINNFWKEKK